jgi:hypothetical protein
MHFNLSKYNMDTTAIKNKLTSAGVPAAIVDKLESALGDKLEGELMTGGLKAAAAKVGIDTTNLPDVDFQNLAEAAKELMGTDVDGDGKTGVTEAVENLKQAAANTDMAEVKQFAQENATGLWAKIKSLFGSNNA